MEQRTKLLVDFLDDIEEVELRLLSWGVVDQGFTEDEIRERAATFLDARQAWSLFPTEDTLLDELIGLTWLFRTPPHDARWRSRFAEGVRLFARLRQLFPDHLIGHAWLGAATLVSDYRVLSRPRQYPKRNISPASFIAELQSPEIPLAAVQFLSQLLPTLPAPGFSKFQLEATQRILKEAASGRASGTIVGAGTGSGKTWAFYLPAFALLYADNLSKPGVRCVALYPRKELLKDQFTEALRSAELTAPFFKHRHGRPLRLGTLFSDTPYDSSDKSLADKNWSQVGGEFICAFALCPECASDVIWSRADRISGIHRLRCAVSTCGWSAGDDALALSRDRLTSKLPDVLFTTTEMLNQRMGDARFGKLFGVSAPVSPRLVLLDEVHTYGGVHGAQVAMLLRRWQWLAKMRAHFVGLSATLLNAGDFFASLTGLPVGDVAEIAVRGQDMEEEGREYMLALRADASSRSATLSTTIQAAMLLGRLLEPPNSSKPPIYGRKVFCFTDSLDIVNRLLFAMKDAEGWQRARPGGSLANLRYPMLPDGQERFDAGQSWDVCQSIGHNLQMRLPGATGAGAPAGSGRRGLRIDRTSSQDAGTARDAQLVVATASLEVGYNDPFVGGIIQHKCPADPAAFLQRKGRAGRKREMRPWTLIVLSDFGRDRLAFQAYDDLFNPVLSPRELPVGNPYIQRMHAAHALLDWLARTVFEVNAWHDTAGPALGGEPWVINRRERQDRLALALRDLLNNPAKRKDLREYLKGALRLSEASVERLLWEPPRSLLLEVVPTLERRLRTNWQAGGVEGADLHGRSPLPEFVSNTLFSELLLPEVQVLLPPARLGGEEFEEHMPVAQALREFAPGKVSRRFGVEHAHQRHWIEINAEDPGLVFLEAVCERQWIECGQMRMARHRGAKESVRCVQPLVWRVTTPPKEILDSSSARLKWHTEISSEHSGLSINIPPKHAWETQISSVDAFLNSRAEPMRVRRFAYGGEATIRSDDGNSVQRHFSFSLGDASIKEELPAAVGFIVEVDAIKIRLKVPDTASILAAAARPELLPGLRISYFKQLLAASPGLDGLANVFQRTALALVIPSMLACRSQAAGSTLPEAWEFLQASNFEDPVVDAVLGSLASPLSALLRGPDQQDAEEAEEGGETAAGHAAHHDGPETRSGELRQLLRGAPTLVAINEAIRVLWSPPDLTWLPWLRERHDSTIAHLFLEALLEICPDADERELLLDLQPSNEGAERIFWITERSIGGSGVLDTFTRGMLDDPRRLFELMDHMVEPADAERNDSFWRIFTNRLIADPEGPLAAEVRRFRDAAGHEARRAALTRLIGALSQVGCPASPGFINGISARFIRPGSSPQTDLLVHSLLQHQQELETALGLELDSRLHAFMASQPERLPNEIWAAAPQDPTIDQQRMCMNVAESIFWERGVFLRERLHQTWNEFADLPPADASLLACLRTVDFQSVDLSQEGWREALVAALSQDGVAALSAPLASGPSLRETLTDLMIRRVEAGVLILDVRVRRILQRNGRWFVLLELPPTT